MFKDRLILRVLLATAPAGECARGQHEETWTAFQPTLLYGLGNSAAYEIYLCR